MFCIYDYKLLPLILLNLIFEKLIRILHFLIILELDKKEIKICILTITITEHFVKITKCSVKNG
jgi:hypothetical protein